MSDKTSEEEGKGFNVKLSILGRDKRDLSHIRCQTIRQYVSKHFLFSLLKTTFSLVFTDNEVKVFLHNCLLFIVFL